MTDDPKTPPPVEQLRFDWPGAAPIIEPNPVPPPSEPLVQPEEQSPAIEPEERGPDEPNPPDGFAYGPRHPWHYYVEGDNAAPVPFDAIPPSESAGHALAEDLPKAVGKRIIRVRELLETERHELARAAGRYKDVIDRGVEALSAYDRTIAYGGNDELARAATTALLYGQVSWRKGRIAFLERENARGGWLGR